MRAWRPWLCAAGSALAGVLAFPPYDLWPAGLLAAVLLLLALRGATPGQGFWLGLGAGVPFQLGFGWWLLPAGVSVAAVVSGAFVCASYLGAFGAAAAWLERRAPAWAPLAVPSAFCLQEWLRANVGWIATPWALLGYSQAHAPLAGIASLAGVGGVSFWLMAAARLLVRGSGGRGRADAALALVVAGLLAGGWLARGGAEPGGRALRVAILQAGRHVPGVDRPEDAFAAFERYRGLTQEAARAGAQLIVWPEASMPAQLPSDRAAREALAALARETAAHLLVASSGRDKSRPGRDADRFSNSVFLFAPSGEIAARYDKVQLLPFNEYVPWRRWFPWPDWIAPGTPDAEAGHARTVFEVDGARFATLICWENLFGAGFRRSASPGVDFVVSVTNEGFTRVGPGRLQLFEMNAFRALENGLPVARAATTGVSAFVGPDGAVGEVVEDEAGRALDALGFRVEALPLGQPPTPYRRFGDWIVAPAAAILALAVVSGGRRGRNA
jgi:apolipoprotein N-acyltransferase